MVPLETLKNIQFLQGFWTTTYTPCIACRNQEFPAGSVVFREGRPSSSVYLVVRGDISLELNVPTRGASDSRQLVLESCWAGQPCSARVHDRDGECSDAPTCWPSTRRSRAFCAHDLSFGFAFMQRIAQVLASRLSATRLVLMDLYHEDQLPARMDRIA